MGSYSPFILCAILNIHFLSSSRTMVQAKPNITISIIRKFMLNLFKVNIWLEKLRRVWKITTVHRFPPALFTKEVNKIDISIVVTINNSQKTILLAWFKCHNPHKHPTIILLTNGEVFLFNDGSKYPRQPISSPMLPNQNIIFFHHFTPYNLSMMEKQGRVISDFSCICGGRLLINFCRFICKCFFALLGKINIYVCVRSLEYS